MFRLQVLPGDWDVYCRWLRLAARRDGSGVVVRFGTNVVAVDDCLLLAPGQWLRDNVLHYFTSTMKRTFKIKSPGLVFVSSYFLTLLFNEGHSDANVEDTFSYRNVATWLSKKMERSNTSLNGIKILVFFQNIGHMHWVTYVIFQDLKIIEEFDSMGPSPSGTVLKGLYRWLFLEYQ
jgi:Ulp1 family protease